MKPAKATPSKPAASKPAKKTYNLPSDILKVYKGISSKSRTASPSGVYYYPDKKAKNNGVDGYYGPKTAVAVKRFQLMHGLVADGIYGPKTKTALEKALK